jgi:hypothetical protein
VFDLLARHCFPATNPNDYGLFFAFSYDVRSHLESMSRRHVCLTHGLVPSALVLRHFVMRLLMTCFVRVL